MRAHQWQLHDSKKIFDRIQLCPIFHSFIGKNLDIKTVTTRIRPNILIKIFINVHTNKICKSNKVTESK